MKKLSLFSLTILIISAIDNMKNMPTAALSGSLLIFFFVFSAVCFLIPTAFASAHLSSIHSDKGGVYHWIDHAFGKKWAFLAVWLQWVNTMVWYPSMLSFIAGTLAYLFYPELAENKAYLITTVLSIFWMITFLNLKGIHTSAKVTKICALGGTILPMSLMIVLGLIWVLMGQPIQINFTKENMLPSFEKMDHWVSLIGIMASFLGIELSGVHLNDIEQPKKNFPKAVLLATLFIFFSMSLSSLSIAVVVPESEIQLMSGVMQLFYHFFSTFNLAWLTPFLAICIAMGSIGTLINWLICPAKGLLHAAESDFLPAFFAKKNQNGIAQNILITQGVIITFFCLFFLAMPNANSYFWFLTALSTELYMGMYLLMFFACLKEKNSSDNHSFQMPFGKWGIWIICTLGILGSFLTIIVSFIPPSNINTEGILNYLLLIIFGNIITISPVLGCFYYQKTKKEKLLISNLFQNLIGNYEQIRLELLKKK